MTKRNLRKPPIEIRLSFYLRSQNTDGCGVPPRLPGPLKQSLPHLSRLGYGKNARPSRPMLTSKSNLSKVRTGFRSYGSFPPSLSYHDCDRGRSSRHSNFSERFSNSTGRAGNHSWRCRNGSARNSALSSKRCFVGHRTTAKKRFRIAGRDSAVGFRRSTCTGYRHDRSRRNRRAPEGHCSWISRVAEKAFRPDGTAAGSTIGSGVRIAVHLTHDFGLFGFKFVLRLEPLQFNHDKSILRRFQSPMRVRVPARASDGRSIALTRNYPLCS